MTTTDALSPTELRPLLLQKVGALSDEGVVTLHRVLMKLEVQGLWAQIKSDGAKDHKAGKFDSLNEVIAEVRADLAGVK